MHILSLFIVYGILVIRAIVESQFIAQRYGILLCLEGAFNDNDHKVDDDDNDNDSIDTVQVKCTLLSFCQD